MLMLCSDLCNIQPLFVTTDLLIKARHKHTDP